jgi:RimJ/RimL family protein N-acetyltransferase
MENGEGPLGPVLEGWRPPPLPGPAEFAGRYACLERLTVEHAPALWDAFAGHDGVWRYMAYGPFPDIEGFAAWVGEAADRPDPCYYAITDRETGRPGGVASYLRITPKDGVIEVGAITYAPALQRTRAATEAMAMMAAWAFEAGYRRYEWKCNALNGASRRAAERLGFSFEGVFRQHMIQKGRSRDTAWFAITGAEWHGLRAAWGAWLDPANFDAEGRQRRPLGALTAPFRVASDPEGDGGR